MTLPSVCSSKYQHKFAGLRATAHVESHFFEKDKATNEQCLESNTGEPAPSMDNHVLKSWDLVLYRAEGAEIRGYSALVGLTLSCVVQGVYTNSKPVTNKGHSPLDK